MKQILLFACMIALFSCSTKKSNCIDESKINKNTVCAEDYNPVCGCDNKTYSNTCKAENAGVSNWVDGPCAGDKK